jgi:hypothetical protein
MASDDASDAECGRHKCSGDDRRCQPVHSFSTRWPWWSAERRNFPSFWTAIRMVWLPSSSWPSWSTSCSPSPCFARAARSAGHAAILGQRAPAARYRATVVCSHRRRLHPAHSRRFRRDRRRLCKSLDDTVRAGFAAVTRTPGSHDRPDAVGDRRRTTALRPSPRGCAAQAAGFDVLDLYDTFKASTPHLSVEGNRLFADELLHALGDGAPKPSRP